VFKYLWYRIEADSPWTYLPFLEGRQPSTDGLAVWIVLEEGETPAGVELDAYGLIVQ